MGIEAYISLIAIVLLLAVHIGLCNILVCSCYFHSVCNPILITFAKAEKLKLACEI